MALGWGSLPLGLGLLVLGGGLLLRARRRKAHTPVAVVFAYGWRPVASALTVLLLFFGLTGYAVHMTQKKLMTDAWSRLQFEMDRIENDIQQQFAALLPVLQGVRSAQLIGLQWGQDGLRRWVESRDLGQEFPGVLGLGMVSAQWQASGGTTPEVALTGVPQFEPRALAPGLVQGGWNADPTLRDALSRAARSGRAALSGPILLDKNPSAAPVLVYAMPVYRAQSLPPTQSERLRTLQSFVLAPVSLPDFLAGAASGVQGQVVFELYDGLALRPELRVFHNEALEAQAHTPLYEDRRNVLIGQRFFQLRAFTTPTFESAADTRLVAYIAAAGSTLGVLFALITWLLMVGRARALALARGMTRDLKRLAMVAERTSNAVIITDVAGHIEWVNEGFTRMSGYAMSEVLGRTPGSFLPSARTSASAQAAMRAAIASGQACQLRLVNVSKSGQDYWLDMELQPLRDAQGRLEGFMAVQEDVTEQVAAQQALAREKERADGILLGSNVGTWQVNLLTGETLVNDQWSRMMGFEPQEVGPDVETFWESRVKPEDLVRLRNLLAACRSGASERYEADFRVRRKDGEWMWLLSRAAVLAHDAQGRPEWLAGIHMDVTEQRLTESGLRDMQAFLDRSGRAAGVGAWEIDLKTQAIHWSDQTCEIHGVDFGHRPTREELLSYYLPQDRQRLLDAMAQASRTLTGWDLTLPFTRPDGEAKWVRIVGEVEFDDSGPVRLVGAFQDVTRIKAAEFELMQTSLMLQSVLDSAVQVAVVATNLERVITVFNKGAEQMLGYRADEMVQQKTVSVLFELEQLTAIKEVLALALGREPDAAETFAYVVAHPELHEWTFVRKDQTRLTVSFLVSPLRDHAGELLGYLGIAHDISLQKQQELHLRQAMRTAEAASVAKSQFLANMSHEIRTPMNAILGMLHLLHNTPLSTQQKDYTDKSEGAAKSLLGLLNDILDFSKVEAGKLQLDPQPFVLDELLTDMSVILSSNLGAKPLDLIFDIDPRLPAVLVGDALRIQQILINLGGNALKFTASGHVTLRWRLLSRSGQRVHTELAVQDTGIGIAPENQGRIFEGFSQAEASTTRQYGGTGLGLAISQRLVRLMGSELVLESVLGQGSTFSFALDLLVDAHADSRAAMAQSGRALGRPVGAGDAGRRVQRLAGMRILVVEDNAINQQVARELLAAEGAVVQLADNGQLGVEALRQTPAAFDVVLMDLQMPVLDGLSAARVIREQLGLRQLPVIAMTANAMVSDREACLAAGMNDHVGKPFDLGHLTHTLRRHVGGAWADPVALPPPDPAPAVAVAAGHAPTRWPAEVDVEAALARMGGFADLYRDTLAAYLLECDTLPGQVHAAMAAAERETARRLVHSFKGLSATVGVTALQAAAAQVELALKSGATAEAVGVALAELEQTLGRLTPLLHRVCAQLVAADATPLPGEPAQSVGTPAPSLLASLEDLLQMLQAEDMAALSAHAALRQNQDPTMQGHWQALDSALAALDFALAEAECAALIETLQRH